MCGIAGTASTLTPDPDLVRRMCDVIVHRGPDGAGYHHDQHASLGMRRLAVIDVATGDQPVRNEDDTVVAVFNGEIYNYPELRRELAAKGHRFRGQGDSETLAHLYEEHGDDLVHRLRGMFAFAIWDRARRRLLLARDRVGKKPLYWRADGTAIHFASELKSLAQDPGMSRDIDLDALHHYLTYLYVPAPLSIYEGVRKLPLRTCSSGRTARSPSGVTGSRTGPYAGRWTSGRPRSGPGNSCWRRRGSGWSATGPSARSSPAASTPPPSSRRWRCRAPNG
ncbi:hypothetical protein GCM10027612_57210 [Microbispora bryophytorum subsp. camponoti]